MRHGPLAEASVAEAYVAETYVLEAYVLEALIAVLSGRNGASGADAWRRQPTRTPSMRETAASCA